jgi:hypothetical protein
VILPTDFRSPSENGHCDSEIKARGSIPNWLFLFGAHDAADPKPEITAAQRGLPARVGRSIFVHTQDAYRRANKESN